MLTCSIYTTWDISTTLFYDSSSFTSRCACVWQKRKRLEAGECSFRVERASRKSPALITSGMAVCSRTSCAARPTAPLYHLVAWHGDEEWRVSKQVEELSMSPVRVGRTCLVYVGKREKDSARWGRGRGRGVCFVCKATGCYPLSPVCCN